MDAHRLLRLHWQVAGLSEGFQIIDSDDQLRILKRIMKNMHLNEKDYSPKAAQWFINNQKDQGLLAHQVEDDEDWKKRKLIEIYQSYEKNCAQSNLIDFADLILKTHQLWLQNPDLKYHYQQRFRHILVDEFQDTNTIQYAWLRLLVGEDNFLTVVGDDDQSIYGWRGAQIDNIHRFANEYPNTLVIRLEENYRSTQTILDAANALIAYNSQRLGKELWTSGEVGEKIQLYTAANEQDEARYIGNQMLTYLQEGFLGSQLAILYRSNAQSRILEDTLLDLAIPYRIYGGLRFFERAEIKDGLAYMQLINNRYNNSAFERVINTPSRRIGERTLAALNEYANSEQISLWQAASELVEKSALGKQANLAVSGFITLIDALAETTQLLSLGEQTEQIIHQSGLYALYASDLSEKGRAKLDNLLELINATRQFNLTEEAFLLSPLAAFLAHASLEAGEGKTEEAARVQLMTIHSAKGLEFPVVFIVGLENGVFPSYPALQSEQIEEERRLCYVGITRAMQKLHLCHAESRFLHGETKYHQQSSFIKEIPARYLEKSSYARRVVSPTIAPRAYPTSSRFRLGQHVSHATFGDGVVLNVEPGKDYDRVQIKFDRVGVKWLVSSAMICT